MGRITLLLLLLALGSASSPSQAQDAITVADIRCVVVGMRLAGSMNSAQQSRGILLAWYYIGRLDGREPKLDIESLVGSTSAGMTEADYASEQGRCAAALADMGQKVARIGQHLIEKDAQGRGKANAK